MGYYNINFGPFEQKLSEYCTNDGVFNDNCYDCLKALGIADELVNGSSNTIYALSLMKSNDIAGERLYKTFQMCGYGISTDAQKILDRFILLARTMDLGLIEEGYTLLGVFLDNADKNDLETALPFEYADRLANNDLSKFESNVDFARFFRKVRENIVSVVLTKAK